MSSNDIQSINTSIQTLISKFEEINNDSVDDLMMRYTGPLVQKELSGIFGVHETVLLPSPISVYLNPVPYS